MLALIKFVPMPAVIVWKMLGAANLPGAGTISALVAIAFILAGVFMYGALKTRADEAERLLKLAREEAAIERDARNRLEKEVAILRAQPDLKQHHALLQRMLEKSDVQLQKSDVQIELLREIKTSTARD